MKKILIIISVVAICFCLVVIVKEFLELKEQQKILDETTRLLNEIIQETNDIALDAI